MAPVASLSILMGKRMRDTVGSAPGNYDKLDLITRSMHW